MKDLTKEQITNLFIEGYESFKNNQPEPANRLKAMGWRLAKQESLNYQIALETAYECFGELKRGNIKD